MANAIVSRAVALPPTTGIMDAAARNFCNAIALRLAALQEELRRAVLTSTSATSTVGSGLINEIEQIISAAKDQLAEQAALLILYQQQTQAALAAVNDLLANFDERVDDRVALLLAAGTNITLTYDDPANTLTINATGGGSDAILTEAEETILSESGDLVLTE